MRLWQGYPTTCILQLLDGLLRRCSACVAGRDRSFPYSLLCTERPVQSDDCPYTAGSLRFASLGNPPLWGICHDISCIRSHVQELLCQGLQKAERTSMDDRRTSTCDSPGRFISWICNDRGYTGTDAVDVGKGILSNFPGGNLLEPLFFGNGTSLSLFTRLLGYHIILVALIGLLFGYHFYLAEMNGFMPSRKKANFKAPAKLEEKDPSLNPWYPRNLLYMVELSFFVFGFILIIPSILSILHNVPLLFSPYPSVSPTSPLATTIPAYPPWFFLFLYKVLDFRPLSPFVVLSLQL